MSRPDARKLIFCTVMLCAIAATGGVRGTEDTGPATTVTAPRPLDEYWQEARACWQRLVRIDLPPNRHPTIGRMTVDRFLESAHARSLVMKLCGLLTDPQSGVPTSRITVRFVDQMPATLDTPEGSFLPPTVGAETYEILVQAQYKDAVTDPTIFVFGQYPENPECAYLFYYRQAASSMAQTLYHELLHIWFLNAHAGEKRRHRTGHGLVSRCEFEDEFLELLGANAAELSTIEGHPPLNFGSPRRRRTESP